MTRSKKVILSGGDKLIDLISFSFINLREVVNKLGHIAKMRFILSLVI